MRQYSNFVEANWMSTYKSSDQLWLTDSLNWEKTATIATSDFSFVSFLYNSAFINQHLLTDSITKISQLDVILLASNVYSFSFKALFMHFIVDLNTELFNLYLCYIHLFNSNYQDIYSVVLLLTPELVLGFNDFFSTYFFSSSINFTPAAVFDSYVNNLNYSFSEGIVSFIMFVFYVWFIIYFVLTSSSLRWSLNYMNHMIRFQYYFINIARETRIQFEAVLLTFVFFLFWWVAALFTFDDDQEEMIEFIDTMYFSFFLLLTVFFVMRHSVHFFSFLEASVSEGRSNRFIMDQFKGDALALFSFSMRFYMTVIRVNIYDTVEDFLDTYYIFVGDFDDDEYLAELFFSLHGTIFFTMDNNDDRSFLMEDESSFSYDLYYIYYMLWAKFAYFFFLTVESALKYAVGLYVTFLITFEIHAVSCSYAEDTYFNSKRLS